MCRFHFEMDVKKRDASMGRYGNYMALPRYSTLDIFFTFMLWKNTLPLAVGILFFARQTNNGASFVFPIVVTIVGSLQ